MKRLKKEFKTWPKWQKFWFLGILAFFWAQGVVFSYRNGNHTYFHTDSSTEGMTWFAANHYLDHGFFTNYLLPTYPPFGHDPEGKPRTEPFVYNHYLAGPDIVAALVMKVFGRDAMWSVRLIPHTLTVVAMGWFAIEFGLWIGASLMACFMLSFLMVPRSLTVWSTCWYGHSYVMAFYLMLFAGMLWLINSRRAATTRQALGLGFTIGFLQMAFDLDWVMVTFLSAASFCLVAPRAWWGQGKRVLIGLVAGSTTALCYQIFISSLYYGSALWVVKNLMQWIFFRTGTQIVEGMSQGDFRLHKILHEYNRQAYGSTGFTAYNWMALAAVFLLMGHLSGLRSRSEFFRGIASVFVAYLGAAAWNIMMRQHSVAHIHFIPRHYFAVFMNFAVIGLPLAYELVTSASRARKGAAGVRA